MDLKKLSVRMDRADGSLWLVREAPKKPIKLVELTASIMLALCADLVAEEGTKEVSRDIKFNDGFAARVTVKVISDEEYASG